MRTGSKIKAFKASLAMKYNPVKLISVIFCLFYSCSTNGQSYDVLKAKTFIEFYFSTLHSKGKIILDERPLTSIFEDHFRKEQAYQDLKDYFLYETLDSIIKCNKRISRKFRWRRDISNAVVLPSDSVKIVFDYNTMTIVREQPDFSFFRSVKKVVVKEADFSNLYITTSVPIFINEYYIVRVSKVVASLDGEECLYLCKTTSSGGWELVVKVDCGRS